MRPVKLTGLHSTEGIALDAGLCPVKVDWTRPVEEIRLGELTGNDWTLGLQRPVSLTGASGQPALCPVKGYNGSISWRLLFKPHGRLWLISLAIFIDIATL